MIIYHYSSTYTVFTSFVSKIFFVLAYSHKYRFKSNKHTKKHKNTSIDEEKQKRGRRTPKTRNIDTELLLFGENRKEETKNAEDEEDRY